MNRFAVAVVVPLCALLAMSCTGNADRFTYVDPNPPQLQQSSVRSPLKDFGADHVFDAAQLAELRADVAAMPALIIARRSSDARAWYASLREHEIRNVQGVVAVADPQLLSALDESLSRLDRSLVESRNVDRAAREVTKLLDRATRAIIPAAASADDAFRAAVFDAVANDALVTAECGADEPLPAIDELRFTADIAALQTTLLQSAAELSRTRIRSGLDAVANERDRDRACDALSEVIDDNTVAARIDTAPPAPSADATGNLRLAQQHAQAAVRHATSTAPRAASSDLAQARMSLGDAAPTLVVIDPELLTNLRLLLGRELVDALSSPAASPSPARGDAAAEVMTRLGAAIDEGVAAIEQELELRRLAGE